MRETLQACCLIGLVFASPAVAQTAAPNDMKSPRLSAADVDWSAVRATLADLEPLKSQADVLKQLNSAIAKVLPKIAASPVPVLLPFDTAAYLRDTALGDGGDAGKYLSGFSAATLFFPGPSGFDAVLSLRPQDAPDLDLTFARPVNVQISGSALLYELDGSVIADETAVPQLDGQFPGIRRVLIESHLRYSFVRYGVPYFVSIECFDGANGSRRLSCREADKVAVRFLKALNVVGGAPPAKAASLEQQPIERPEAASPDFTYYAPGDILPGTGSRGQGGRADFTVYAKIRFPMAQAPAYANSQSFMNWGNCDLTGRIGLSGRDKNAAYRCRVNDKTLLTDESKNYAYPWRDNFCEHRGYYVGQCPAGLGHQGQDIRPAFCLEHVEGAGRCDAYQEDVVAVADGVVMRSPGDRSLYLVVDKPGEHIRFRYLHMNPQMLDAAGMISGREVAEGEVLGAVGNYGREPGGTTYHLHFDAQVPTRDGWVFVNPYMTLVAAYERLIGARGQVVNDAMFATAPAPVAADGQAPAAVVGPRADAKQSIDDALKIESEPKSEPKREGERKTAGAEHCTTYVHRGHRRQICRGGVAESSVRERHTVRSRGSPHIAPRSRRTASRLRRASIVRPTALP
jgi:murein DD-endopeptidase MepM/ murein hydrolase activator NlpD